MNKADFFSEFFKQKLDIGRYLRSDNDMRILLCISWSDLRWSEKAGFFFIDCDLETIMSGDTNKPHHNRK